MAVRGPLRKPLFPPSLVGFLWFHLILPSKTSIPQAISNKIQSFKLLWRNVNETCDVDVAIVHAGYQSKKKQGKDYSVFFVVVLFTGPVSPPGIYGTLLLSFMLLKTTVKRKHTIRGCLHLFAWNCVLYWSADHLHACAWGNLAKRRF